MEDEHGRKYGLRKPGATYLMLTPAPCSISWSVSTVTNTLVMDAKGASNVWAATSGITLLCSLRVAASTCTGGTPPDNRTEPWRSRRANEGAKSYIAHTILPKERYLCGVCVWGVCVMGEFHTRVTSDVLSTHACVKCTHFCVVLHCAVRSKARVRIGAEGYRVGQHQLWPQEMCQYRAPLHGLGHPRVIARAHCIIHAHCVIGRRCTLCNSIPTRGT